MAHVSFKGVINSDHYTFSWPSLLSKDRPVRIGFHDPSATATGLLAAWPFRPGASPRIHDAAYLIFKDENDG